MNTTGVILGYREYEALPADGRRYEIHPDIVYVDRTRLDRISKRGVEGAPTLTIEVLSPTTTLIDRTSTHQLYAKYGVPFFWLIDPASRSIEADVLGPQGYSLTLRASGSAPVSPPPFPGLALPPEALWP